MSLIRGLDPGGAQRPIQVDDNGNLSVDLISGITVSTTVNEITNTVIVRQVSGSTDSVSVTDFAAGSQLGVLQASGSVNSINILEVAGTGVAVGEGVSNAGTLRTVQAVDSAASVRAIANSGVDIGDVDILSIAAGDNNIGNVDVLTIAAGDNNIGNVDIVTLPSVTIGTFPDNEPFNVAQIGGTATAADSGVTNAGTLRVVHVTDVAASTQTEGKIAHDAVDSGNPVKIGGIARTANPTAVAALDRTDAFFDTVGRQVITPYQVRGLIATAYLSLSNGTEVTLAAAGGAGVYHDLVYIMCANQSDAAADIDFRDATAGGIVFSITVPADATAGLAPAVPIPQNAAALPWTADMGDTTGTTVNISALFIKNV